MKKLSTIVVEDERLPRLSLLAKLEAFSEELEVVDSCESYDSARDSILRHRPDLLLLDIQLQGRDSLELLEEIRPTMPLPYVIFTTAYSDRRYLMGAIKLQAVDYLLKPVGKDELAHAVAKAVDRFRNNGGGAPAGVPDKLSFRSVNGRIFVTADDIAVFKAEGNYATLVTFSGEDLILESLSSLEKRLPEATFIRADRKTIVNLRRLYRINQHERTCTLQTTDGRTLEIRLSRNGVEKLLSRC